MSADPHEEPAESDDIGDPPIMKAMTDATNYLLALLASEPDSGVLEISPGVYYVSKLPPSESTDTA